MFIYGTNYHRTLNIASFNQISSFCQKSSVLKKSMISFQFFVVFYFLFRRRSNLASLQTVTIVKKSRSRVFSSSSASRDKNSRQHNFVTSSCDAKPVSQPVTCPNGVILDLEDCCQMTLCDQVAQLLLFFITYLLRHRYEDKAYCLDCTFNPSLVPLKVKIC